MTEPRLPGQPPADPADDLLLAQALDAWLSADRAESGRSARAESGRSARAESGRSAEGVDAAPERVRDDLRQLHQLAQALQASAAAAEPSPAFRAAARARLMQRVAEPAPGAPEVPGRVVAWPWPALGRRAAPWLARAAAGLVAVTMAGMATLTASASALPGDALYGVKQASEAVELQLAADERARVLTLLRQADARLDETTRLLQQGRTGEAASTAERYERTVEQAAQVVVSRQAAVEADAAAAAPRTEPQVAAAAPDVAAFEARLVEHQQRLEAVLAAAPEPARTGSGLQTALEASRRGLERAAEVHAARSEATARTPAPASPGPSAGVAAVERPDQSARSDDAARSGEDGGRARSAEDERLDRPGGRTDEASPKGGPEARPTAERTADGPDRGRDAERGRGDDRGGGEEGRAPDRVLTPGTPVPGTPTVVSPRADRGRAPADDGRGPDPRPDNRDVGRGSGQQRETRERRDTPPTRAPEVERRDAPRPTATPTARPRAEGQSGRTESRRSGGESRDEDDSRDSEGRSSNGRGSSSSSGSSSSGSSSGRGSNGGREGDRP